MSATYKLFSLWKTRKSLTSDNAGAIALGISRSTVSLWKTGKNAEIQMIERMAEDIGQDATAWAAMVMAERATSDEERASWSRFARKLGGTAALLLVFFGAGAAAPEPSASPQAMHYAKWLRRLAQTLLAFFRPESTEPLHDGTALA